MITNADITIYNKYIENRVEKWQRAEVHDVVWQAQRGIAAQQFQTANNTVMILIPLASGAEYAEPKYWQETREGWTLQEGDVIVRGIVTDEIDTEYGVSQLRADHQDVVSIMTVDTMDQGTTRVRHWEVQCK